MTPVRLASFRMPLPAAPLAILLVEQDIDRALAAASRVVCLPEGRVVLTAPSGAVDRAELVPAYFGAPGQAVGDADGAMRP